MTLAAGRSRLPAPPLLMLVTEPSDRLPEIIAEAVAGGVTLVQTRHFVQSWLQRHPETPRDFLWSSVYFVQEGVLVSGFDSGTQLPEVGDPVAKRLKQTGDVSFVGRSIHSVERAIWAAEDGADYLVAGTIYPSQSHPGLPGQGVDFLRQVCQAVAPLTVIAIGGITPERVGECIAAGAAGVAVLSPIMRAYDPRAVAAAYREELDKAWNLRSTENQ